MSRKPNLFIIGAMKSVTTSLDNYLNTHPNIFMSPVKEPEQFSLPKNFNRGDREYLNLFSEATNETYVGESSTGYSKMPSGQGVAQRIHDYAPESKIVYID